MFCAEVQFKVLCGGLAICFVQCFYATKVVGGQWLQTLRMQTWQWLVELVYEAAPDLNKITCCKDFWKDTQIRLLQVFLSVGVFSETYAPIVRGRRRAQIWSLANLLQIAGTVNEAAFVEIKNKLCTKQRVFLFLTSMTSSFTSQRVKAIAIQN